MLDRLLVVIGLLALAAFTGIIVGYVRELDLTVAIVMIVALAFHDFWISVLRPGAGQRGETREIEARPHPVSGEPLAGPKDDYTPRG